MAVALVNIRARRKNAQCSAVFGKCAILLNNYWLNLDKSQGWRDPNSARFSHTLFICVDIVSPVLLACRTVPPRYHPCFPPFLDRYNILYKPTRSLRTRRTSPTTCIWLSIPFPIMDNSKNQKLVLASSSPPMVQRSAELK